MAGEIKKISLRDTIIAEVGSFLYKEGFKPCDITPEGILELINMIADYEEEGKKLYPEVIVTNNLAFFKTIPNYEVQIKETELSVEEFKNVMKLCAPLSTAEWIIFVEIKDQRIRYGLVSAEVTETTPSIYKQTVGEMKVDFGGYNIAYIRNIGNKTVEFTGLKSKVLISLTLSETKTPNEDEIKKLSKAITQECDEDSRDINTSYFEKLLSQIVKESHGNLVGIVKDDDASMAEIRKLLPDGLYLDKPIDIAEIIKRGEQEKSRETSVELDLYTNVVKGMVNHDGLSIFTSKGRLIGYHIKVTDFIPKGESEKIIGGMRTKAFESMRYSKGFQFGFFKSQDGLTKIFHTDG